MAKPSVYDELQCTIDLVTPPKKHTASTADSTASVAGSVWDAGPTKAAVYWLCTAEVSLRKRLALEPLEE